MTHTTTAQTIPKPEPNDYFTSSFRAYGEWNAFKLCICMTLKRYHIFYMYSQSKCFFLGAIISSVVALHTDLASPWPAKLCLAANRRSFIVCPAIMIAALFLFHDFHCKIFFLFKLLPLMWILSLWVVWVLNERMMYFLFVSLLCCLLSTAFIQFYWIFMCVLAYVTLDIQTLARIHETHHNINHFRAHKHTQKTLAHTLQIHEFQHKFSTLTHFYTTFSLSIWITAGICNWTHLDKYWLSPNPY